MDSFTQTLRGKLVFLPGGDNFPLFDLREGAILEWEVMQKFSRRRFVKQSVMAAGAMALGTRMEERQLQAYQQNPAPVKKPSSPGVPFPTGKIGNLEISRLICGGNLISGFAHSRDLIYVSDLLRHYFTDEKVLETLHLCEAYGLNAMVLRLDDHTLRILKKYRASGGKMHWIAQVKLPRRDRSAEIKEAVQHGAAAVYIHGGVGDALVQQGQIKVLAQAVEAIRRENVPAGIAGHRLEVIQACEAARIEPDFYMKTFNSKRYWSAQCLPRHDSVWAETPEQTRRFMEQVERPWIAYKVLAAGAIPPEQGFRYAYQNGADFLCVGMFDWQIAEDVEIARRELERARLRSRPWYG